MGGVTASPMGRESSFFFGRVFLLSQLLFAYAEARDNASCPRTISRCPFIISELGLSQDLELGWQQAIPIFYLYLLQTWGYWCVQPHLLFYTILRNKLSSL